MNSRRKPKKEPGDQDGAEPFGPADPSDGSMAQWIWPFTALVVVIGGMVLGCTLFT